ncbi:MAG: acetyl-CoA carboxylase biotin carboxyl carrier protein subunit, partial [Actinomycetota bacterium]|nr:acetyl-CoA carboxylase biotin carboxyl carrier protein subunit [Actinomycetota bacterium]
AAVLACDAAARAGAAVLAGIPSGWRNVLSQPQVMEVDGAVRHRIAYRLTREGLVAEGFEGVELITSKGAEVVLDVEGLRRAFAIARYGNDIYVDSALGAVHLVAVARFADPADEVAAGSLLAPMPGTVVRISACLGDEVTAGQPILWLEAMKMQHQINAPADGLVTELPVREGQQVDLGAILAVVTPPAVVAPKEDLP